jgi:hypothetical protein
MNASRRIMKKPLMGSFSSAGTTARLTRVAKRLIDARVPSPVADAAARDVAAAHRDVDVAAPERGQHRRQDRFVVLQVGVHHRDVRRRAGERALDAGRRQAASPDALDDPHARVALADPTHGLGGPVGRVVVDVDHFPRDAREGDVEPAHELGDVVRLVERGHDDRQFGAGRIASLDGMGRVGRCRHDRGLDMARFGGGKLKRAHDASL